LRHPLLALAALATLTAPAIAAQTPIAAAVADPQRSAANRARDPYRHPVQTLAFFGIKPTDNLVEFVPGGGWFTEILAPLVKGKGQYTALVTSPKGAEGAGKLLAGKATWFGPTKVAVLDAAAGTSTLPPASADAIVTFRNVHNLLMQSDAAAPNAFRAFFAALKPGGTLGVEDHHLPEAMDSALEKTSGYVKRSTIVKLATDAGFKLAAESPVNANPKDTHDHPKGVWTLPPTYELGDVDRAKYQEIGESDRVTLKFVKPKG
jgi:predicted methyltransferase